MTHAPVSVHDAQDGYCVVCDLECACLLCSLWHSIWDVCAVTHAELPPKRIFAVRTVIV